MKWKTIVSVVALCALNASHALAIEWEVWLSDQSNSADIGPENPTGTFGSRIIVYEGRAIATAPPGTYGEGHPSLGPAVIEATDVFPNALSAFGVNVGRLHGMLLHPSHRFLNVNFFSPGAGLVGIIDAEGQCTLTEEGYKICEPIRDTEDEAAKLAKALFRTTGPEGSAPSNHMSFWTAGGTKLIVANLGAKLLERIDYDQATDTFTFNKAATLDLVGGRDLTTMEAQADPTLSAGRVSGEYVNFQTKYAPSGALKEGPGRPNNVVVCPIPSSNGKHAYVTLGGGGLFVVDTTTEPMSIVAEYTNDVISAAGCGGAEGGGFMHLNAGVSASPAGADDSTFILYRLPLDYPDGAAPYTTPNEPPIVTFYEEKTMDITSEAELANRRDAHGLVMSPNRRFLYQFDRIQNNAEVFDMGKVINDPNATLAEQAGAHAATLDLTGSGLCVGEPAPFVDQAGEGYEFSDDPAPDLVDISPDGRMIIVSFRGPHPVTVKHAAQGSCPGFGVVTLEGNGSTGTLTHVFRTFLPDATGTKNLSDIHAAAVRIKGPNTPLLATVITEEAIDEGEGSFAELSRLFDAFGSSDSHFDLDGSGTVDIGDFFLFTDGFKDPVKGKLLALAQQMISLPDSPQLQQNVPNPFNSETVISWFLLRPSPVRVEVFSLTGQRVAVLHQGIREAGVHRVHWDGRDDEGRPLASGIYLYRLMTNESVQTRKLTLLQ